MANSPGITDWISSPLSSIFQYFTSGGNEAPQNAPLTANASANMGRSGIVGGFEHVAEDHPFLTALALAWADHKVNNRGLLGSIATFWSAKNVLEGDDSGIMGTVEKIWLANEFKNVAEKAVPGDSIADTIAGWGTGILSYMEMGNVSEESRVRHHMAPA